MHQQKSSKGRAPATPPPSPRPLSALRLLTLPALLLASLHVSPASAYVYTQSCDTATTLNPGSPGSTNDTQASLCPSCCKVPLNMSFVGNPSKVFWNTGNADKCITLCADSAFYAVNTNLTCLCYDSCNEQEQQLTELSDPLVALGNITACMTPCFPPTEATEDMPRCECPSHSSCVPIGGARDPGFRCCCDPTFDFPTILPDNSSVCMAFELGSNLAGVTIVTPNTTDVVTIGS